MKKQGNIKCDVSACKHNDCKDKSCSLNEVKISCTCHNNDDCKKVEETICQSFEK